MHPYRMKKLFFFSFILLFSVSLVSGALPPEAREKIDRSHCQKSGGEWKSEGKQEGYCICPDKTISYWSSCWIVTPKETCLGLGGKPGFKKGGYACGGPGCSFKCTKDSKDITSLARDKAQRYNKNITNIEEVREQINQELPANNPQGTFFALIAAVIILFSIAFYKKIKIRK